MSSTCLAVRRLGLVSKSASYEAGFSPKPRAMVLSPNENALWGISGACALLQALQAMLGFAIGREAGQRAQRRD
eukprot:7460611-Pyramimonas_sp.AAC.1